MSHPQCDYTIDWHVGTSKTVWQEVDVIFQAKIVVMWIVYGTLQDH